MNDQVAANRADDLLKLIVTHQQNVFGTSPPLYSEDNAKKAAQALAALRAELIERLKPQL